MELTENDKKALECMKEFEETFRRGFSCTDFGEHFYGNRPGARKSTKRQGYALPGGKVIQRLIRAGLVKGRYDSARRKRVYYTL